MPVPRSRASVSGVRLSDGERDDDGQDRGPRDRIERREPSAANQHPPRAHRREEDQGPEGGKQRCEADSGCRESCPPQQRPHRRVRGLGEDRGSECSYDPAKSRCRHDDRDRLRRSQEIRLPPPGSEAPQPPRGGEGARPERRGGDHCEDEEEHRALCSDDEQSAVGDARIERDIVERGGVQTEADRRRLEPGSGAREAQLEVVERPGRRARRRERRGPREAVERRSERRELRGTLDPLGDELSNSGRRPSEHSSDRRSRTRLGDADDGQPGDPGRRATTHQNGLAARRAASDEEAARARRRATSRGRLRPPAAQPVRPSERRGTRAFWRSA